MTSVDSSVVGGYRSTFADSSYGEFICDLCSYVTRDPSLTSCCGEHFCEACITPVLMEKKPCPYCGVAEFTVLLDKNYQRKVLALRVHCTLKDRGCQWTGKLEQLDAHLDVETGVCEYVDIECPEKCGQQIQKHQLATHVANECPKRDFNCKYCGFKATYEVICGQHMQVCESYPLSCPNGPECDVGVLERFSLDEHLKVCRLQVVECDFSYAGCNKKLPRQDMEKHMEESKREHLTLMAAAMSRIGTEFECKLQEQRKEFQENLQQKQRMIRESEAKLVKLQKQLQNERQARVLGIPTRVANLEHGLAPPCYFTILYFTQHRETDAWWTSPPIYTHQYGYKFCVRMATNGYKEGKDTHISLFFYAMKGEYDDTLSWPAKGAITVELLNQHKDANHHALTLSTEWPRSTTSTNAWEISDKGMGWKSVAYYCREFSYKFITHQKLEWNSEKETQYLKENCLRLRITKVKISW